jgi:hypothetical protein
MNPNNYASLEASQRLVEAGVMLETDAVWIADEYPPFGASMKIILKWDIRNKKELIFANFGKLPNGTVPAPSMAEVWRELPTQGCYFTANQGYYYAWMEWTDFDGHGKSCEAKESTNPTDALIDLLIWVRKEAKPC